MDKVDESVEATNRWWALWSEEDYSWPGLAKHPLQGWSVTSENYLIEAQTGRRYAGEARDPGEQGLRPATLQDYWRADSSGHLRTDAQMGDELIICDGHPTYHAVHAPFLYSDGTTSAKDLAMVKAFVDRRLSVAEETFGAFRFKHGPSGWYAKGADRRAQLVGGIFSSAIVGPQATTHINASRTHWAGDAIFDAIEFGPAAEFTGSLFSGLARFHRSRFLRDARFTSATFLRPVDFEGAVFQGEAAFYTTKFYGDTSFRSGSFDDTVWFTGAHFGNVEFRAREFRGLAYFETARFQKGLDFVCATFNELASFERVYWPESNRDWHAAFDHALFRSTATFRGAAFKAIASFAGASFERGVQLDEVEEDRANAAFQSELDGALEAANLDLNDWPRLEALKRSSIGLTSGPFSSDYVARTESQARWIEREMLERASGPVQEALLSREELDQKGREFREQRLAELEAGCRTLKQAMALVSNKSREQMLYRFELIVRRKQRRTPLPEKVFSWTYGAIADYGASIVRPIVSWLGLVAIFALGYWCWIAWAIGAQARNAHTLAEALSFSWDNAARPFSATSVEGSTALAELVKLGPWFALGVRTSATIESLLSIVLLFLFALAIRRRFQME